MGLCMGIVKCRPRALVTTAWLVPRCRGAIATSVTVPISTPDSE